MNPEMQTDLVPLVILAGVVFVAAVVVLIWSNKWPRH
ncbi:hypothetical protein [Curtobacterium phage Parvaparticeps]|nr:hypothetical protein [Curtobacterium phage Parvaparticeps]